MLARDGNDRGNCGLWTPTMSWQWTIISQLQEQLERGAYVDGVIGTVRARTGWSCLKFRGVTDDQFRSRYSLLL